MNLTSFRQELQTAKVALDTDRTSTEESSSRASVSTGKARISRKDSQSVSELLYASIGDLRELQGRVSDEGSDA